MKPRSKLMKVDEVLNVFLDGDSDDSVSDLSDEANGEPVQQQSKPFVKTTKPRQPLTPLKTINTNQIKPKINENQLSKNDKSKTIIATTKPNVPPPAIQQFPPNYIHLKDLFDLIKKDQTFEIKRQNSVDSDDDAVCGSDDDDLDQFESQPSSPVFGIIKATRQDVARQQTPNKKRKRNS